MGLFKKRTPAEAPQPTEPTLGEADRQNLLDKAHQLVDQAGQSADETAKVTALNEAGDLYTQAGDTAAAIDAYEQSMGVQEQFGPAYNGLLNLYNVQLKSAAHAKDNDQIQHWTTKLDELMAMSKRVMRSRY